MRSPLLALIFILGPVACGQGDRPAVAPPAAPATPEAPPPDRHVLDLGDGTEVWLTAGRSAHSAAGVECRERGVELRKEGHSIPVPLLYTVDDPVMLNGKLVASLASLCTSGPVYTIDATTGQPTPLPRARR